MNIYVASYVGERETTKQLQEELTSRGHHITVDWTAYPGVPVAERNSRPNDVQAIALRDLEGIRAADVFILLANVADGRAKYAELGAAIMSAELTSKPKIYVVGKDCDHSIFYFHPNVERVSDTSTLLIAIGQGGT